MTLQPEMRFHPPGIPTLAASSTSTTMLVAILMYGSSAPGQTASSAKLTTPYGLETRPQANAYLLMPQRADAPMPPLLSQTGAFSDTRKLTPSSALIPFDINVPFWSDGATKSRWISVPNDESSGAQKIKFSPTGEWTFPKGTTLVKHFELPTDDMRPEITRRLETRLLICDSTGGVYGVTYKWRPDGTDADLLPTNLTETIRIKTATGVRTQTWYYPSREDCRTCHTDKAGGVLGPKTRQLNREMRFPSGITDNELRAWNHVGLFEPAFDERELPRFARLARVDEPNRSVEDRARSYLDANCSHCHRPGGTAAYIDARYDTPLSEQNLIDAPVLIDQGVDRARAIAPHDLWRSIVFMRVNTLEAIKMPPLAHEVLDESSVALLRDWISSMSGPQVLAPPKISPRGGSYAKAIDVTLAADEPDASIHYTLDGSAPTSSDPVYDKPIKLSGPTVVRARAFKPGFTKSISVQQVFMIGD